jgi:adenylate cyclase
VASFSSPAQRLERTSLDLAYRYSGAPSRASDDIVILAVDSKSLLAMRGILKDKDEPWPWRRLFYGAVADFLARSGAKAVAFDLDLFGPTQFDYYEDDSIDAAKALRASGIAYLALNFKRLDAGEGPGPRPDRTAEVLERSALQVIERAQLPFEEGNYDHVQVPFDLLSEAGTARRLGAVNAVPDLGGSLHEAPLLLRHEGKLYPSLSLATFLDLRGVKRIAVAEDGRLELDGLRVPLGPEGRYLINWYGPERTFPSFTIHQTIRIALADYERRCPPGESTAPLYWNDREFSLQYTAEEVEAHAALFRGKTVFVGANASELGDVWSNPFSSAFPGVEIHATVLSNLLEDQMLERLSRTGRIGILIAMALVTGLGTALLGGEKKGMALFLGVILGYACIFLYAFQRHLLWLDFVAPTLTAALAYGSTTLHQYFGVGRTRRQLRKTFDRVLQPGLIDLLLREPQRLELGGEERKLTVLFSDLQDFTTLAEGLSPSALVKSLNHYFSSFTGRVLAHGAYLDKYIGDGVMAVWGAPGPVEHPAAAACLAALELRTELAKLRWEFLAKDKPPPVTRMGIHSGLMVVGMVGSEGVSHYTVMGDNVVIASRLEGANKVYGTQILVGEQCRLEAKDAIVFREIDLLILKGKAKPIRVYEPVCIKEALKDEDGKKLRLFETALERYRARRWKEAIEAFHEVLRLDAADGPSRVFLDRSEAYARKEPAPGWKGEYVMREK